MVEHRSQSLRNHARPLSLELALGEKGHVDGEAVALFDILACDERSAAQMSYLVEILLPQETGAGEPIGQQWFADLLKELTSKFGGATSFMRSPGEGMWKSGSKTQRDDIVIIEIMTDELEQSFWKGLRERMEAELSQQEIVMRSQEVRRLLWKNWRF